MSLLNRYNFRAFHRAESMKSNDDGSILVYSPDSSFKNDSETALLQKSSNKNRLPLSLNTKVNRDILLHPNNGEMPVHINDSNNNKYDEKSELSQKARDRFRSVGMKARFARRMEKIVEDRMTVKQIFNRYVQNSTLHGFRFIFMETFVIRRLLWTILTLIMATVFFVELKNSIELFYQYPFTTTSTVQYESNLTFPAISICNLNPYLLSRINSGKLKSLYEDGRLPFYNNWGNKKDPGYEINGKELHNILKTASQGLKDLFISCEWKSRDTAKTGIPNICKTTNFTIYHNLHGQTCFTFNSGIPQYPLLSLNETGLNMAFKLELDLKSMDSLVGLHDVGINVVVHHQEETPMLQAGFVVSPGFQTFVEMRVRKTENLPPPYATRCGSRRLIYYNTYRQSSCFLEVLGEEIREKCKCRAEFMPGMVYHVDLCVGKFYSIENMGVITVVLAFKACEQFRKLCCFCLITMDDFMRNIGLIGYDIIP